MPLYEVEHTIHLSPEQLDKLAEAITRIHTRAFTTPSLFVNIRFTNVAQQVTYVGGKPKRANRILASVRSGGGRSNDQFEKICKDITEEWDSIVGTSAPEYKLRAVFVLGTITTAMEAGFMLPQAGDDVIWMKANRAEFKKLAGEKESEGDPDFKELVREMNERDDLKPQLGDEPEDSDAQTGEGERKEEGETSHEGHTPDQFKKISAEGGDTPEGGNTNEKDHTSQPDKTQKEDQTIKQDAGPQQGQTPQQYEVPQEREASQQSQPQQGGQYAQEGQYAQGRPYAQYYIHDLDSQGNQTSQGGENRQGGQYAQDRQYELRGGQYGQQGGQYEQQGGQYAQDRQYEQRGGQYAQQGGQSAQDRQYEQRRGQYGQQGGQREQQGGQHEQSRRAEDGPEIGQTSQDRTMGRQSSEAEVAQAQALHAKTAGPDDRSAGPFTGA
ncbi:hypothetical protein MMC08_008237 [Hypocenomyce scalaris]|nr:hypothetical protein [Hypocenomyce scalaris]